MHARRRPHVALRVKFPSPGHFFIRQFDLDGCHFVFGGADPRVAIRTRDRVEQAARRLKRANALPGGQRADADGQRYGFMPPRHGPSDRR